MKKTDNRPVLIEVTVFGTYHMKSEKTPRSVRLMAILKEEGGINASVPPGKYYFNTKWGPAGMILTLEPV